MNYSLQVENLSKAYVKSDFKLEDVSFSLLQGSIMGFVGENGAGKTTTISVILNTLKKDSGTVKIFGEEMTDFHTDLRNNIGVVFDSVNFAPILNTKKLSKIFSNIYKNWDEECFQNLLSKLNIPRDKKIKEFSRGMGMKLSIAVALSHNAKLLILDEATAGLDPIIREEILDLFLDFVSNENHSILMSSHITADLEKVADYITFIHEGRTILTEKKDTLIYEYGVARCKAEQFTAIDKAEFLAYRKRGLQVDVLVENKQVFEKSHRDITVDSVTVDEIMILLVKGEK